MTTHTELATIEARERLQALHDFCTRMGGACYANWTAEALRDYLEFHALHNSLAYTRDAAGAVSGVGMAWQMTIAQVHAARQAGRLTFDWTPNNPAGDCVFLADCVATGTGPLAGMWTSALARHPHWRELPWFTYRHGQLMRFTLSLGVRMFVCEPEPE